MSECMGIEDDIKREREAIENILEIIIMSIKISSEEATKNLEGFCNQVIETNEIVRISRPDGKNVVLISEAELESLL
jgi:hypothetical protein